MDWVKIPKEHHPLFLAALPNDPRVSTMKLFGGIGAAVNGNMFGALWAKSVMTRLSASDYRRAVDELGATPFDPMRRGKPRENAAVLPDNLIGETKELRVWLQRALDHAATLPAKNKAKNKAKNQAKNKATVKAKPSTPKARASSSTKARPAKRKAAKKKSARKSKR
mgnify:CR=1 FL=1